MSAPAPQPGAGPGSASQEDEYEESEEEKEEGASEAPSVDSGEWREADRIRRTVEMARIGLKKAASMGEETGDQARENPGVGIAN